MNTSNTNTSNTKSNGNGANGSDRPLREKVEFRANKPVVVTLEFNPPTEPRAGRFGDQYMYFFADERIAWFDPPVHALIVQSGARVGSTIEIEMQEKKKGNRKSTDWVVTLLDADEPAHEPDTWVDRRQQAREDEAADEAAAARRLGHTIGETTATPAPSKTPAAAPVPAKTTQQQQAPSQPIAPSANPLAQALILAIDAVEIANQHGVTAYDWDEGLQLGDEAIVKLAITAYIQAQGGKQARA